MPGGIVDGSTDIESFPDQHSGDRRHDEPELDKQDDDGPDAAASNGSAVRQRRVGRQWGRFAELWVPEPLRDARVDPGRRGALILLLVAALAAVATAVGVWRDRPEPRPIETSSVAALAVSSTTVTQPGTSHQGNQVPVNDGASSSADAGTGPGEPSPAAGAAGEIVVSVTGLVGQPGIVTLPAGSRVADAIAAAGGAAPEADLTGVNLAERLADGDSVVVGTPPAPAGAASGVTGSGENSGTATNDSAAAGASGLINLNTADEAALDTLPGVGPVMAQNILAWRETNGRFTTVEQLQEISGIGPSRYAQISALVTVS